MEYRTGFRLAIADCAFGVKRTIRAFLCLVLVTISGICLAEDRPNFLLILLDDAGWTDVGCYGSKIQTPNIDRLAAQGMRFTDCHSAAPNCSPSRAGLLTGRTPSRVGVYSYIPDDHVMHLRGEEVTLAELLKAEGYHTGHFGKWHLSRLISSQPGPHEQGFDYSLGTDNNASPSHLNPTNFVRNGERIGPTDGYSCQIVVDETISWLEQIGAAKRENRFFACVWFHEPHERIASPPNLVAKYRHLFPELTEKEATYHANIDNVDRAVGRLVEKLEQLGIGGETLVFLTSDNGPLSRFSRAGLRGRKSNVWEGGHRVPGIFRWPDKIRGGSECSVPISGIDYLPTVCDIVRLAPPTDRHIDGQSLLPLLLESTDELQRETPLYWFFYRLNPALAMREGAWSLIANTNDAHRPKAHPLVREDMTKIRSSQPIDFQLFNLESDLLQAHDVSAANPEIYSRLKSRLAALHAEVVKEGHQWDVPEQYGAKHRRRVWNSE